MTVTAKRCLVGLIATALLLGLADVGLGKKPKKQRKDEPRKAAAGIKIDVTAYRIGISSDGNLHDTDDIGASAMAMAMIGEAGLADRLVHHDYSSHLGKSSEGREKEMAESVLGAAKRWGVNAGALFDDQKDLAGAVANIARQINASSEKDRFYYCVGGPMEVAWRGINASDKDKRKFCTVVSHSNWNNKHADTPQMKHTWDDIRKTGVEAVEIRDQNRGLNTPLGDWDWLKNARDEKWKWLFSRNKKKRKFDVSDAGMVWFVITGRGDEDAAPAKVKDLFENGPVKAGPAEPKAADKDTDKPGAAKDEGAAKGEGGGSAVPAGKTIVLKAANHDGKDKCWTKRNKGNGEWGIRGSHRVESGNIWFDSFPGATGRYRVGFRVVTENDGHPHYRISAGGRQIGGGQLPLPQGNRLGKGKAYADRVLDLGIHEVRKGDKINVWAKSVYPMGRSHGAYCRWSEMHFTPVK
jgi:hypothetical protein